MVFRRAKPNNSNSLLSNQTATAVCLCIALFVISMMLPVASRVNPLAISETQYTYCAAGQSTIVIIMYLSHI